MFEDNEANLRLLGDVLVRGGHTPLLAPDGPTGLALARERAPALVLLDVDMPGMDGFEVLAALRADPGTAALPVVALTAHAMSGDEERLLAAGFDHYVAKPLRYRAFLDVVGGLLGG